MIWKDLEKKLIPEKKKEKKSRLDFDDEKKIEIKFSSKVVHITQDFTVSICGILLSKNISNQNHFFSVFPHTATCIDCMAMIRISKEKENG